MLGKKTAVFFDRDGVLNVDYGYVYRQQDFVWLPGAIQAIKLFNANDFLVFVITNQSGVARGYYTEADIVLLHNYMNIELAKQGAHIDKFYYCPHYKGGINAKYAIECSCRKPAPGMIQQAIKEWQIDVFNSIVIGDKMSDVRAAEAAGLKGYLFTGENLYDYVREEIVPSFNGTIYNVG